MLALARFAGTSLSDILEWPVSRIVFWTLRANDLAEEIKQAEKQ
jgi:hypothetical protein